MSIIQDFDLGSLASRLPRNNFTVKQIKNR